MLTWSFSICISAGVGATGHECRNLPCPFFESVLSARLWLKWNATNTQARCATCTLMHLCFELASEFLSLVPTIFPGAVQAFSHLVQEICTCSSVIRKVLFFFFSKILTGLRLKEMASSTSLDYCLHLLWQSGKKKKKKNECWGSKGRGCLQKKKIRGNESARCDWSPRSHSLLIRYWRFVTPPHISVRGRRF